MKAPNRASARFPALDGLRGVAALVVVVHHALLVNPSLADVYDRVAPTTPGGYILGYTPLHILWAGAEPVWLFFVLSGFVLTLPYREPGRLQLRRYYPARLVRLYVPAIASLALAAVLALLVPRPTGPQFSTWMQVHVSQTLPETLRDALLVLGGSPLNTPLWSLQYEVIFSLALPVALLLCGRSTRLWPGFLAVLLATMALGSVLNLAAIYLMAMFLAGMTLAANHESIRANLDRVLRCSPRRHLPALVLALLMMTAPWTLTPLELPDLARAAAKGLALVGVVLILLLVLVPGPVASALSTTSAVWLGSVSFSLYLVHEPLVVSVGVLLGPARTWLVLPVALPLALLASWLFYRGVERPSHRLARRLSRAPGPQPRPAPDTAPDPRAGRP